MRLHLASQSPRRRQLLEQLGLEFGVVELDIPEHPLPGEPAQDYVSRVAREKAGAGLFKLGARPGVVVLGADTEVVLDDEIFGKPADAREAAAMLRRLSGRAHWVLSAVWLVDGGQEASVLSRTEVHFAELGEAELEAYLACGEWQGKAGAYAIQGRAAAFISHLSGSYSGVMGLPLHETAGLLRRFGLI